MAAQPSRGQGRIEDAALKTAAVQPTALGRRNSSGSSTESATPAANIRRLMRGEVAHVGVDECAVGDAVADDGQSMAGKGVERT